MKKPISFIEAAGSGGAGLLANEDRSSCLRAGYTARVVYCLQGNGIDRADTAGCNGRGWRTDQCYTLDTVDRPAVVYPLESHPADSRIRILPEDSPTPTITAKASKENNNGSEQRGFAELPHPND